MAQSVFQAGAEERFGQFRAVAGSQWIEWKMLSKDATGLDSKIAALSAAALTAAVNRHIDAALISCFQARHFQKAARP